MANRISTTKMSMPKMGLSSQSERHPRSDPGMPEHPENSALHRCQRGCAFFDPESDGVEGIQIQSMLCVPLVVNAKSLRRYPGSRWPRASYTGVARLYPTPPALLAPSTVKSAGFAQMIASMAAGALYKLRLDQQLKIANADLRSQSLGTGQCQSALGSLFENLPDASHMVDSQYQLIAINRLRKQRIPQQFSSLPHIGGKENRGGKESRLNSGERLCYQALFSRSAPCPECLMQKRPSTQDRLPCGLNADLEICCPAHCGKRQRESRLDRRCR